MRVHATPDRTLIRAGAESVRYVRVSFTAPPSPRRVERWPVNAALVLDRSGSMAGRKIELAREATVQALRLLRPTDRFALVVYDDEIALLSESAEAAPEAKHRALERLARVRARHSTDLSGGWLKGIEQLEATLRDGTIPRCLLLTDGLANRGITDRGELIGLAGALGMRGISTSTFGVGEDFDERLLRAMAEASAGHFYYVEAPEQIPDLLASELGETLEIVARDAVLEVALGPGMTAEPVTPFRWERAGDRAAIQLGHLVSNQELEVVVKLGFPPGEVNRRVVASFTVTDPAQSLEATVEEIRWTWADDDANDRQPRNRDVDLAVARLYAARARDEAVERNRAGDREGARRVLRAPARRISQYAGDDPELCALVVQLEAEAEEYGARPLSPSEAKAAMFAQYAAQMSRAPSGKARRGSP